MFYLKNKTAVVTGGAKGIGKSIALVFVRQSADVHIIDPEEKEAGKTVREITGDGGNARFHQADVVDQNNITDLFGRMSKHDEFTAMSLLRAQTLRLTVDLPR